LRQIRSSLALAAALAVVAGLAGCASYRPAPLPRQPDLAAALADLDLRLPAAERDRPVNIAQPLTIDDIGLLAILNNPGLKSERGTLDVAGAALLQATLIPDPTATLSYGQLIAGPGTASSIAASLAQDIAALVTRAARVNAAAAHVGAVNAEELWREWQVAQKARQLAVDLYWDGEAIRLVESERHLIGAEIAQVRQAIAKGNLTLTALAPLLTAQATAEQSLGALRLAQLKGWQALDALMGLLPRVRFAIARPKVNVPAGDPLPLIASLPARRPDLAALRLGYLSAEERVRAAILGQFPAFSIGPQYGSDTTKVVTIGPSFTFALPIFDRARSRRRARPGSCCASSTRRGSTPRLPTRRHSTRNCAASKPIAVPRSRRRRRPDRSPRRRGGRMHRAISTSAASPTTKRRRWSGRCRSLRSSGRSPRIASCWRSSSASTCPTCASR
jgi:outer membrane protein, heavy metal efflux system